MSQPPAAQPAASGFELVLRIDPSIYDGRFANNGWLQELPKPLTKVTWDNVAIVSPNSAKQITGSAENEGAVKGREHYVPVVEITNQHGQKVRAPLWIQPGQPDGVVTLRLGYGRRLAGRVGGTESNTVGFDAYLLRNSFEPWFSNGIQISATGEQHVLATTQLHFTLEDPNFSGEPRDVIRSQTLAEFLGPEQYNEKHDYPTLYPEYHYDNQAENAPN